MDANAGGNAPALANAELWARHIERASMRLPGGAKCLPQAMALSWILQAQGTGHQLIIAAQPESTQKQRDNDTLHAWLECDGQVVIGDLPGPWVEVLRLGATGPSHA